MAIDIFSERALISISNIGGTDREFSARVTGFDTSGMEKDFDSIPTMGGGRVVVSKPQADGTITITGYFTRVSTVSGTAGEGAYDLMYTATDVEEPISITNDHSRTKTRIVIMGTTDSTADIATSVTAADAEAKRWTFEGGYIINITDPFPEGDKVFKTTITYKFPPFDISATGNITVEATDGTAVLPAITAYTA